MNAKKFATAIEFIGIIAFFVVYKFAPQDVHIMYASATLLVVTIFQFLFFYVNKLKIPRHVLLINILAIAFTIPAIIYNDFKFLRIKLLVIKFIFFIVPFMFLVFRKNFFLYFFQDMAGIKELKPYQFDHINIWYVVTSAVSLAVSIYAAYYLSDDDFVYLKTFWLPFIGSIYILPIFYYTFKNEAAKEALKRKQAAQFIKPKNDDHHE